MSDLSKYFEYKHLPEHLQLVSKPVGELANVMKQQLPDCDEKAVGMRKLLEAKDCFVRAALTKSPTMKIRFHRGSLEESMKTMKDISISIPAIRSYLLSQSDLWLENDLDNISVKMYDPDPDTRIDWDKTYIVNVKNQCVALCDTLVE